MGYWGVAKNDGFKGQQKVKSLLVLSLCGYRVP